jgi:hypothetical protein
MTVGMMVILLNWVMLFETWRTGRFHSCVPLIGAGFFCLGSLALPAMRPYAWLAFFDIGTVLLIFAIPSLLADGWRNRFGLLEVLIGEEPNQTIMVRLLRKGHCVVYQSAPRSGGEFVQRSMVGTWSRSEGCLILRIGEKSAVFQNVAEVAPETWRLSTGANLFDGNADFAVAALDLTLNYRRPSRDGSH